MGSCISKCKPKKACKKTETQQNQEECKCQYIEKNNDHAKTITPLIQDKLVISQAPITSPPPKSPPKTSLSSAYSSCTDTNYPTTSSSSSSSTCLSTNTSLCSLPSSASSLASSSSIQSSKLEHSFSNDFLWSCVKDNPQILNEDYHYHHSIKVVANSRRNSLPMKSQTNTKKVNKSKEFITAPSPQRGVHKSSAPQKRPRCNTSPSNLTRQKSFRREAVEAEPPVRAVSRSGRDSRPMSPSSSRRFNGEGGNQARNVTSSSLRRDHNNCYVRPQSPNKSYNNNSNSNSNSNNSRKYGKSNNLLANKRENENNVIKEVGAKSKELGMGGLVSNNQDVDMTMPIEDINNPHIALDCFIFL